MNDTVGAIAGFAIIGGLFVAYALERRGRARGAAPPKPIAPAAAAPVLATDQASTPDKTESRGSSINWGMPLVYCLLLWGSVTHRHSFWGYFWQVPFFALLMLAAYSTFSAKELSAEQKRRPGTTRTSQYVMLGVPYLLLPTIAWILAEPLGWMPGILLPALPWIPLVLIAVGLGIREQWQRGSRRT